MKALLISLFTTALIQLANITSGVLAARLLLPEGRGALAMAMLWPALFAVVGFISVDQGAIYFSANRQKTAASLFTAGVGLACGLSVITVLAGYSVLPLLFGAATGDVLDNARFYLLFVPLNFVGLIIMGILVGTLRFGGWNFQRILVSCFYVGAIVVFYAAEIATVRSFLIASLLANLALVSAGIALLSRQEGFGSFSWQTVLLIVRYSIPVHLALLISVLAQRLDQALISLYLPAADLGIYIVAGSVAATANLATGTIGFLAFPKIASQTTVDGKAILLGRYLQLNIAIGVAATCVVFLASPWLVTALFGSAFGPAVRLSRILLIGAFPASMATLLAAGYRAYGRNTPVNYAAIATLIVTAAMLLVLLPRIGTAGAAWSVVSAQWVSWLLLLAMAGGSMQVSMRTLFVPTRADIASLRKGIAAWAWRIRTLDGER